MTHECFYVLHLMCSCNATLNKPSQSLGREMLCLQLPGLRMLRMLRQRAGLWCCQLCLLPAPALSGSHHLLVSDTQVTRA